ncbi:MAG: phage terminase large subunit [Alphaproteobacteria bacterium]|nr:phage terminase large subunit [Alphaproteobacteria bacterium]HOY47049.1 phage terminase large subunit [Alphaproteobacteria bacterium]
MKTQTITEYYKFLDEWNKLLNLDTPKHHKQITEFLADVFENSPKRGLLMAFRHSGKSSVVGIFAACVLYLYPQTRILILSAETKLSSRMVSHIKHILENHPKCSDMLPDVKKEWGSHKITIERPIGIREPSVICQGIHGNVTGLRADLIICDDVEVPNTSNTNQKRESLRERLRELDFILSPNGAMIYIGTPHTVDTIYRVE